MCAEPNALEIAEQELIQQTNDMMCELVDQGADGWTAFYLAPRLVAEARRKSYTPERKIDP